ncbi:CBS domain-containing protein [Natronococcus wangiae]|uniref:CBS domain-containing protein n=1 Tax=Natronococcus wangiae TaxID=3068275 RepID=UPI00273D0569|nr:CBS domain-containing protein [Natronococcus sp. AD5]
MTVKEIARPRDDVVTATPDTAVWDLAQLMEANSVGSVIIERDDEIASIVTDLALEIVAKQQLEDLTAEGVMTKDVFTVNGDYELFDVFAEMDENNVRRIPVEENGQLAGIIMLDDMLAVLHSKMGNVTEVVIAESPPHPNL